MKPYLSARLSVSFATPLSLPTAWASLFLSAPSFEAMRSITFASALLSLAINRNCLVTSSLTIMVLNISAMSWSSRSPGKALAIIS